MDLARSLSMLALQHYDKSKWFHSLNSYLILHLPDHIKDFGPVMGWWSMIFERLQFVLKKKCHSPKKPELTLVKEINKQEFISDIGKSSIEKERLNFVFDFKKDKVCCISKGKPVKNRLIRGEIFDAFIEEMKRKYPQQHRVFLQHANAEQSIVYTYDKIRVGNILVGCTERDARNKRTKDSTIHLHNRFSPRHASRFYKEDQRGRHCFPTFASVSDIYAIKPFNRESHLLLVQS
jgi:hypothetical protein